MCSFCVEVFGGCVLLRVLLMLLVLGVTGSASLLCCRIGSGFELWVAVAVVAL